MDVTPEKHRRKSRGTAWALIFAAAMFACAAVPAMSVAAQETPRESDGDLAAEDTDSGASADDAAQKAMRQGDWAAAKKELERRTAANPKDKTAWNDLGVCQSRLGETEPAVASFTRAHELDSDYFKASFNLGLLYARAHKIEEAEKAYREALRANPNYGEALYNLANLLDDAHRVDEAAKLYEQALKTSRAAWLYKAHFNLGLLQSRDKEYDAAAEHYKASVSLKPDFAAAHINLGVAYKALKQYDAARASLGRAQSLDEKDYRVPWNLALLAQEEEDREKAAALFKKTLELKPDYAPALFNLALYAYRAKAYDEARTWATKAVEADHEYGEAYALRGRIASVQKDLEAAIADYRSAAQCDPSAKRYFNLGLVLRRANALDEAASAYETAIKLDAGYEKAWLNLGYVRLYQKRFDDAEKAFNQALQLKPNYANALDALKDLEAARKNPAGVQAPKPAAEDES